MVLIRFIVHFVLIVAFTGLSTISAQVQEVRIGSFTKHQPNGYEVEGKAYLEDHVDSIVLRLSPNFNNPEPGPDLDVYLASQQDVQGGSSVRLASLQSNTGEQSYLVPDSIGFQDYDYAMIYCTQYDHEWAQAQLSSDQDTTNDDSNSDNDTLTTVQQRSQAASLKMSALRAWRQDKTQAFEVYDVNGRQILSTHQLKSLSQLQQGQMYIIRYQIIGQDAWQTDNVVINR
jgi:hypothetical protein